MSASYGLLLRGDGKGEFTPCPRPESGFLVPGQARDIQRVRTRGGVLYVVARNNDRPLRVSRRRGRKATSLGDETHDQQAPNARGRARADDRRRRDGMPRGRRARPDSEVGRGPAACGGASSSPMSSIYDIFSPPQASRAYAYVGHRRVRDDAVRDIRRIDLLPDRFAGSPPVPRPAPQARSRRRSPACTRTSRSAARSRSRERGWTRCAPRWTSDFRRRPGMTEAVFARSVAYGDTVAKHVLAWAGKDRLSADTRRLPKYTVTNERRPLGPDAARPTWTPSSRTGTRSGRS